MKQKLYALVDSITASSSKIWWTVVGMSVFNGVLMVVSALIQPGYHLLGPVGIFFFSTISTFVGFMLMGGLLHWASNLLGFENCSFERALGALGAHLMALIIPSIIVVALSPLSMAGMVSIVFWLVYIIFIVIGFILMLHVFGRAYRVTKGKAFGAWATAVGLLFSIVFGVILLIAAIVGPIIGSTLPEFGEFDFEAYNSLELDLEESSFQATGTTDLEPHDETEAMEE